MHISDRGLNLLKQSEGLRTSAYKDQAGLDTIGYGHLITHADRMAGRFQNPLTEVEATQLLQADIEGAEEAVIMLVNTPINQNQFDALVDFVFNLGQAAFASSTLLKRINRGDMKIADEFLKWSKVHNPKTGVLEENKGLLARRKKEAALWDEG